VIGPAEEPEALYAPLAGERWVLAQLGQSLDGQIATAAGASCYVTGPENLDHLHRLRALADAVVVGAGTVQADDPRLTVRRVAGDSPVRVALDTERRLDGSQGLFSDGLAPTLLASCLPGAAPGRAELLQVPRAADGGMDLAALLAALAERGLRRVLVEGGGVTVSRFLRAGLLDRLHLCVAPLVMGRGRPGLQLPPLQDLAAALRPRATTYAMGGDVLFDLALERRPWPESGAPEQDERAGQAGQ